MVVVVVVMILVVGPKELPGMLRNIGKTVGNLRRMAGDFQRQFNDALREAELHELKEEAEKATNTMKFAPLEDAKKSMEAFQETVKKEQAEIQQAANSLPETDPKPVKAETSPQKSETTTPAPIKAATKTATTKAAPSKAKPASAKTPAKATAKANTAKSSTSKSGTTKSDTGKTSAGKPKPAAKNATSASKPVSKVS